MLTDESYELIRQFASPVVAITTLWRGRTNGMISDSAMRASISPRVPRVSVYIHKWHFSHDLIWQSGQFVMHLLHRDQMDLVHRLGFVSGRDQDKLQSIPHHKGVLGVPILDDCYAAFECRVINTMDAGHATHYLGDVVATHRGRGSELLTPDFFRANMPETWREEWQRNYRAAQEDLERHSAIQDRRWPGLPAS
jgi:flavin reductase (DIM6/NTAB) family NADH-FMN oxidoreductase RutF